MMGFQVVLCTCDLFGSTVKISLAGEGGQSERGRSCL